MFVWGRNIYLVQLLSAATPGMTSPVRKRVPVGQICNRLQAQMDSETGTTSTPLSPTETLSPIPVSKSSHPWQPYFHWRVVWQQWGRLPAIPPSYTGWTRSPWTLGSPAPPGWRTGTPTCSHPSGHRWGRHPAHLAAKNKNDNSKYTNILNYMMDSRLVRAGVCIWLIYPPNNEDDVWT